MVMCIELHAEHPLLLLACYAIRLTKMVAIVGVLASVCALLFLAATRTMKPSDIVRPREKSVTSAREMNVLRLVLVACLLGAAAAAVEFTDCTPFVDQNHRGPGHRFAANWTIEASGELGATLRPAKGEAQASLAFVRTLQVMHFSSVNNNDPHLVSNVEFVLDKAGEFTQAHAPLEPSGSYKAYAMMHDGNSVLACASFRV